MNQDELDKVEQPAIDQLKQLGWTYIHCAELTPEAGARAYQKDVVLVGRLDAAIKRINPYSGSHAPAWESIHCLIVMSLMHYHAGAGERGRCLG